MRFGPDILAQADALAAFTEDPPGVTRTYLTREHRRAGDYLIARMREAGMRADYDALGNVVGRYEAMRPGAPVVMTGSHMDSVRNAGRYDGIFGVLTAIACVRDLARRGVRLAFDLEVVAFGDEEGVRFGVTLIGSKAMGGSFDPAWLAVEDAERVALERALREFGGDPGGWRSLDRRGRGVVAYIESHIEQGPVLLNEGLPVGVVTAIAGASRMRVAVSGLAGHAGTVPMGSRQDALAAAAEMTLAVERIAAGAPREDALVATVGTMSVRPGAINVIAQDVGFGVDVRSGDDAVRRSAIAAIRAEFDAIARRRGVRVAAEVFYEHAAAPCDPRLRQALAASVARQGLPVRHLPSGAGHDAMAFPPVCPIAMLFARCGAGGISHHPDESLSAEDAETATVVLLDFLETWNPT
jgi:hydantoinase/carbamoylase family amidase